MEVEIFDVENAQFVTATIDYLTQSDSGYVGDRTRFPYRDWKERIHELNRNKLFKITYNSSILGLLHLELNNNIFYKNSVEIYLIEKSKENRGDNKRYRLLAECLIAFACYYSINNFSGMVVVEPLDKYKDLYINKYGMVQGKLKFLKSDIENSKKLVRKYVPDARI